VAEEGDEDDDDDDDDEEEDDAKDLTIMLLFPFTIELMPLLIIVSITLSYEARG